MSDEEPEEATPRPEAGDDDGEPGEGREATPKAQPPRRKRKKTRAAPAPTDDDDDDNGLTETPLKRRDRIPAFALDFPDDPALDALVAAFDQGDYARVRREAPALVKSTESVAVRKAARELLKRLDPDPVAVYLLAGAALLLTFLAVWYWTHPHVAP